MNEELLHALVTAFIANDHSAETVEHLRSLRDVPVPFSNEETHETIDEEIQ